MVNNKTKKSTCVKKLRLGKLTISKPIVYARSDEYDSFLESRMIEFETACKNISIAKKKKQEGAGIGEDVIIVCKWNDAGLLARVPTAAGQGWTNNAGAVVATASDMKEHIIRQLTLGANGGVDLGYHHDVFQFLPSFKRAMCMEPLVYHNQFLCHHGRGWAFPTPAAQAAATLWPDIVDYLQEITIVKSNAAVGPVDLPTYFN